MAKEEAKQQPKWSPGAWTPKRCAVWYALAEELRVAFSDWVAEEAKKGEPYASQILPEHEAILAAAPA